MNYDLTSLAIVFGIMLLIGGLSAWLAASAEHRLRRWAEDNGLTIMRKRQVRFARGPFTWTAAGTDFVYRITARDSKENDCEGWARVTGIVIFPWRGSVEAKWIAKPPAQASALD